jgi:UDP-N-acetylglucosamine:LPS N-acetylglucosamine transferase
MERIVIVSARVGAGHDGAAEELARRYTARGRQVDRYDFLDLLPGRLGQLLCDSYHRQLQVAPRSWDWLLGALGSPPLSTAARRFATLAGRELRKVLTQDVSLVVSTYPLATHALAQLKRRGSLEAPFAVYLTDPAVHRLCVSRHADLHIAPNEIAREQAQRLGALWTIVSDPVVAPGFRPVTGDLERADLRRKFGLPAEGRLALVLCGSWGIGEVERIAVDIAASGPVEPVVVCGRNDALRTKLADAGVGHVFGWVKEMPELMRACDLVVQNAGGLTTYEALGSGLPVLTYRSLPGHGRANAEVLDAAGVVPWVRDQADLPEALNWAITVTRKEIPEKIPEKISEEVPERIAG